MNLWTTFKRWALDLDVDEDGKEFPKWHMRWGDKCLDEDCRKCGAARQKGEISMCYPAHCRSEMKHFAKYKVNRRFLG